MPVCLPACLCPSWQRRNARLCIHYSAANTQGGRTVPRIFVDGKFIGGADDVTAMDARGDLEALLRENSLVTAR